MDNLKEWWAQASSRDQLYILVLGVAVIVYLLYMLMYKPVQGMRDEQLERNVSQRASLERVKALAAELKDQSVSGNRATASSIESVVQPTTRKYNLRINSQSSGGVNSLRMRFDNARFEDLMAWLYEIEIQKGIKIIDATITKSEAAGIVSANLRLKKD